MTKNFKKKFFSSRKLLYLYQKILFVSFICITPLLFAYSTRPPPSVLLASVEIYYLQCLKKFYRTHLTDSPYLLGAEKLDH